MLALLYWWAFLYVGIAILASGLHVGIAILRADPGFQVRGAHLKKLRQAEGGTKFLGYFVWKITILRQKIIFVSNFRRGRRVRAPWIRPWALKKLRRAEGGGNILGYFVWFYVWFYAKKILFSPILGGVHPPPWNHPYVANAHFIDKIGEKKSSGPKLDDRWLRRT